MGGEATEPLKVILLGNSGVGKSNLIARFYSNEFSAEFESTVGVEFVTKRMDVDGVPVKLQIWDTAGQERYASMMKTYYKKAKGALLVYDVTNQASFTGIEVWRKHLESYADPRCVSIVTGNKMDMDQAVPQAQAMDYAARGSMGFMLTSAKTGENVEAVFVDLARRMLQAGSGGGGGGPGGIKLQAPPTGGKRSASAASSSDCC